MTSENILDVLASVEEHRDELQDAIRAAIKVLRAALDEDDHEAASSPAPSSWKSCHDQDGSPYKEIKDRTT